MFGRLLVVILLLSGPFAYAQETVEAGESGETFTAEGESGAVLDDVVVEAQNEVRQDVEKQGYEFELSAAMIDSFLSEADEAALEMSPVSGLKPHLNNIEDLASDQTPHYWLPEVVSTPVARFYPEPEPGHDLEEWKLVITDFRGAPFRTFEGGDDVPDELVWDGFGDDGSMLRPGYPYSYVFTQKDEGTNTYNHAGVSFRVPALRYPRGDDLVLEFSGGELFQRHESRLRIGGEDWLTHAADVVRAHPYSPVRVEVEAEELALAEKRSTAVAHFLADAMQLPREQVEIDFVQRSDLRAELDGHVRVVILHAD
ncbi:MAG TPA: hypothetical protein VKA86_11835 [Candidatus Krumholzibacteria bacterium]|nr:hypothetical protein [Candidatus Krumholzibacteria bacterium]